ncbi:hypothetical protein [Spongiibacter tropicus]|uniref:hypothetical protein n=1 Tax=Spongiibacter tropicus TaxID=454602 RepID=UPI0035BE9D03
MYAFSAAYFFNFQLFAKEALHNFPRPGVIVAEKERKKHGVLAFIFSLTSFIPMLGIFIGIICIVIAATAKKSNSLLLGLIGAGGILLSVVLYGSLAYNMFKDDNFSKAFEPHAKSAMTSLIKHIEYYKLQYGYYPESMDALRENFNEGEMVFAFDMSAPRPMGGKPRDFYYEVINDGSNYLLFGIGLDEQPFTTDDIFPLIDPEKDKNIGWVREP